MFIGIKIVCNAFKWSYLDICDHNCDTTDASCYEIDAIISCANFGSM